METLPEYVKFVAPSLPTFPQGSTALYIDQSIPQRRIHTWKLPHGGYKCVAVKVNWGGRLLAVASNYVRHKRRRKFEGVLEGLRSLI